MLNRDEMGEEDRNEASYLKAQERLSLALKEYESAWGHSSRNSDDIIVKFLQERNSQDIKNRDSV